MPALGGERKRRPLQPQTCTLVSYKKKRGGMTKNYQKLDEEISKTEQGVSFSTILILTLPWHLT
jgi:hypothetical protein